MWFCRFKYPIRNQSWAALGKPNNSFYSTSTAVNYINTEQATIWDWMVRQDEESRSGANQRQRGMTSDAEQHVLDSFSTLLGGFDFPNVTCQWEYYTSLTFEIFFQWKVKVNGGKTQFLSFECVRRQTGRGGQQGKTGQTETTLEKRVCQYCRGWKTSRYTEMGKQPGLLWGGGGAHAYLHLYLSWPRRHKPHFVYVSPPTCLSDWLHPRQVHIMMIDLAWLRNSLITWTLSGH